MSESAKEHTVDPVSDYEIAEAMQFFGGSFVAALGYAWHRGDDVNRATLMAAFPEYVEQYRELARLKRARQG